MNKTKSGLVKEDYLYLFSGGLDSYQADCSICGISSFSHYHKKGTLPKDFTTGEEQQSNIAQAINNCPHLSCQCVSCGEFVRGERIKIKLKPKK